MAVGTLEALDEVPSLNVPNSNALVQRASSHKLGIGGDGYRGDAILDAQNKDVSPGLNIPETNRTVTAARSNSSAITCEVERVNVLFVTMERVPNLLGSNVPDLCKSAGIA